MASVVEPTLAVDVVVARDVTVDVSVTDAVRIAVNTLYVVVIRFAVGDKFVEVDNAESAALVSPLGVVSDAIVQDYTVPCLQLIISLY